MDDLFAVDEPVEPPDEGGDFSFIDDLADGPAAEEQQSAAGATVDAGVSPELAEMRRELENLNRRLADTQAGFHQANQGRQFAEEIIKAQREDAAAEARRRAAAEALAPPTWTEEQVEALHNDPSAILTAIQQHGEYVRQRTLAEVGPYIARLDRAARLVEPIVEQEIIRAEQGARSIAAAQWGIDDNEYRQLAPIADGLLRQASRDEDAYKAMRLNPGVIATAFSMAKTQAQGGVPVRQSPRPPSFGAGGGGGGGSQAGGGRQATQKLPNRLLGVASQMEKKFGLDAGTIANAPVRIRQGGRL